MSDLPQSNQTQNNQYQIPQPQNTTPQKVIQSTQMIQQQTSIPQPQPTQNSNTIIINPQSAPSQIIKVTPQNPTTTPITQPSQQSTQPYPRHIQQKKPSNSQQENDVFIFPKDNLSSRVEIPFSFQDQPPSLSLNNQLNNMNSLNSNMNMNNSMNNNQSSAGQISNNPFHSFIKIQNTPTLYLDISDEASQEKLICDGLKTENQSLNYTVNKYETNLSNLVAENTTLKDEFASLQNEYVNLLQQMNFLNNKINANEIEFIKQCQLQKYKIDTNDLAIRNLLNQYNIIELNNNSNNSSNNSCNCNNNSNNINNLTITYEEYLQKKFTQETNDNNYLIKNLTNDLIDFEKMNTISYNQRMLKVNIIVNSLKENLGNGFDVKIYGSYATKMALEWSDVDIMIIPLNEDIDINNAFNKTKYNNIMQNIIGKLNEINWISNITQIDEMLLLPKLKVETTEKFDEIVFYLCLVNKNNSNNNFNKVMDIINAYASKYEGVFIPIVIAIKQLLYNNNMISNYNNNSNINGGISSFALTVLIINFLNELGGKIDSLGEIFLEFLTKYGIHYDNLEPEKRIITLPECEIDENTKSIYMSLINSGTCEIIIVDPCEYKNNLTEKTFRFSNIKLSLLISYFIGKDTCECSCHYKNNSMDFGSNSYNTIENFGLFNDNIKEHCVLGKIFKAVKRLNNCNNCNSNISY